MDKKRKRKDLMMIVGRLTAYILIGVFVTNLFLFYIDHFYLSDDHTLELKVSASSPVTIPPTATCISFTSDHRYVSYIDSGALYIANMETAQIYDTIREDTPICYAFALEDRNLIVYFVHQTKGGQPAKQLDSEGASNVTASKISAQSNQKASGKSIDQKVSDQLLLKTYDLTKKEKTPHQVFNVPNFKSVKQVEYSSMTNLIYVNVTSEYNSVEQGKIFRIDIMKNVSAYASGSVYEKILLLDNTDTLFYQDNHNQIYVNGKKFTLGGNEPMRLIGCDRQDRIYMQSLTHPDTITILKDNQIVNTLTLSDANYTQVHVNQSGLYLYYPNYAINLTGDPNRKISFDMTKSLLDISDKELFLIDTNHVISTAKIK